MNLCFFAPSDFELPTIHFGALGERHIKVETLATRLTRNGRFLIPESPMRWPDGTITPCFRFRHVLQQQTVYQNLPLTQRITLHRHIAECLEIGFGNQAIRIAAELTRHFAQGNDFHRAAAYAYLAGQSAVARSGYIESIRYFTKSLDLLGQLGDVSTRIEQEIQSLIIAETGGRSREAEVYRVEGELQLRQDPDDPAKAEACFERAFEVAREQQAKSWELRTALGLAQWRQQQGKMDEAHGILAPIYKWFTEGLETTDLQDARNFGRLSISR